MGVDLSMNGTILAFGRTGSGNPTGSWFVGNSYLGIISGLPVILPQSGLCALHMPMLRVFSFSAG
jgi:hypothetical protein